MSCGHEETTCAYIDGELEGAAAVEAERHIEGCRECQGLVAAASEASELLRGPATRLSAPPELRSRIARSLDAEAAPRRRPDRFWLGAFGGAGAGALAAGLALTVAPMLAAQSFTVALADSHVAALSAGRTVAVLSSSHHTVKPWFAGRAPVSPPVQDFADQGFPLAGGRVDKVRGQAVAVVAYRHGAHEIDLFVWPKGRAAPPARQERHGYHVVGWTKGDLAFTAVSDVQADELQRFVGLVQAARE
jgi:anti-sigma factor RsiW